MHQRAGAVDSALARCRAAAAIGRARRRQHVHDLDEQGIFERPPGGRIVETPGRARDGLLDRREKLAQPRDRRLGHLHCPQLVPDRARQFDVEFGSQFLDQRRAGDDTAELERLRRAHVDLGVDAGDDLGACDAGAVAIDLAVAMPGQPDAKAVGTELAVLADPLAGYLAEHLDARQGELGKASRECAGTDLVVAQPPAAEGGAMLVHITANRLKQAGNRVLNRKNCA
ncbi:hypothetical protein ACTGJ9_025220 [Bradyrhizobium sp. RDM12]